MNLLLLNGLTIPGVVDGTIHKYFQENEQICAPYRWNWRARDWRWVLAEAFDKFQGDSYVVAGFSDGATLAIEIALYDPFCEGAMIHSGQYRDMLVDSLEKEDVEKTTEFLVTYTNGDLTRTSRHMKRAAKKLDRYGYDVTSYCLPKQSWHGHQFAPALSYMYRWFIDNFDEQLPLSELGEQQLGNLSTDATSGFEA